MSDQRSPDDMQENHQIRAIASQFSIDGNLDDISGLGEGRINDTYLLSFESRGLPSLYTLQRINSDVFTDPAGVIENVARVTEHIQETLIRENTPDRERKCLTLIPTHDGDLYHVDSTGACWRMYRFIDNTKTYDVCRSVAHSYEAGKAFGQFQTRLQDIPDPALHETIPHFHNTPQRFDALIAAVDSDEYNRAKEADTVIQDVMSRHHTASTLTDLNIAGAIPTRIAHNDTKMNNLLFDNRTDEALCVIDLDTVMPGLSLYDYGDLVRSAACTASEDEGNAHTIALDLKLFGAVTEGYLSSTSTLLNKTELDNLVPAVRIITLELAVRFLTDHLAGDKYFKISRQNENLDRCGTQLRLLQSMEKQEEAMNRLIPS